MDDPLSSLGLTAIALYQASSPVIDVLIKRPYKNTLAYQRITFASYQRIKRLSESGSAELIQVPNTGQQAYFLFYWQKRYPLDYQYSLDLSAAQALKTKCPASDNPHPAISSSSALFGT